MCEFLKDLTNFWKDCGKFTGAILYGVIVFVSMTALILSAMFGPGILVHLYNWWFLLLYLLSPTLFFIALRIGNHTPPSWVRETWEKITV